MNHRLMLGAAVATIAAATACGATTTVVKTPAPTHGLNEKTVELRNSDGTLVGTVTLSSVPISQFSPSVSTPESPSGSPSSASPPTVPTEGTAVRLHVVITALSPGSHGFDIHAVGKCDPPDFTSSGGHFNPSNAKHGHLNPSGPQAGDLGNLPVGGDGKATVDLIDNLVTLDPGKDQSLVGTTSGTSLIVHAKADDEVTQPEGGSGARIACGVISANTGPVESPTPQETPSAEASPTPETTPVVRPTVRPTIRATAKPIVHTPTPTPTRTATPTAGTSPTATNCPTIPPHAPPC